MNKNIEDILKEALENHDAGYVSGAWESMSARLDGTAPTPFYKKWWVAAAFGTVLVGTAAFFMLNETPAQETKTVQAINSPKETTSSAEKNSIFDTKNESAKTDVATDKQTYFLPPVVDGKGSGSGSASWSGVSGSVNGNNAGEPGGHAGNPIIDPISTKQNPSISAKYSSLDLPKTVCLNEEISITNPNEDKSIFVIDPSGKKTGISSQKESFI